MMSDTRKSWLIEAGDVLEVMPPGPKQPVVTPARGADPGPAADAPFPANAETIKRRPKPVASSKSGLQIAPLVALTYLLGPLAILLTPQGRRQKSMVTLALMSMLSLAILIVARFDWLVRVNRPASAWLWSALVGVAVIGGFSAWSRAVHLIGSEGIPSVNRLPHWLRRGRTLGGLSLIAPGSGMLLSGRADRAAITLWLLGPPVLALVILLNTMGLWRHHLTSGWLADAAPTLETAILVAAGLVVLGFLGYIAQALEGMRQVLVEPGLKTRVKGDYYALAFVAAVVALVVVANPAQMARQLGVGGQIMYAEGFRTIPLQLNLAAAHLDPARSEYTLRALDLYVELDQPDKAAALRAGLDRDLGSYVALVQKETVAGFGLAQAGPSTQSQSLAVQAQAMPVRATATEEAVEPSAPDTGLDQSLLVGTFVRGHEPPPNK